MGSVTQLEGTLNLEGSVKTTRLKLTWLPNIPELVPLQLVDFGPLITKKKLEEEDVFEDFVNPNSVCCSESTSTAIPVQPQLISCGHSSLSCSPCNSMTSGHESGDHSRYLGRKDLAVYEQPSNKHEPNALLQSLHARRLIEGARWDQGARSGVWLFLAIRSKPSEPTLNSSHAQQNLQPCLCLNSYCRGCCTWCQ